MNQLKVMVWTGSEAFPHGMASTQRIRLVAKALAEAGASVCIRVAGLDRAGFSQGNPTEGVFDGIPFRHVLGHTTLRSGKLGRICDRVTAVLRFTRELSNAAQSEKVDIVYSNTVELRPEVDRFLVGWTRKRIGVPIVSNLVEAPWSLWDGCGAIKKRISPLHGIDAALVISRFLMEWASKESSRLSRVFPMLYFPIVVDLHEAEPDFAPKPQRRVIFAGAPAYDATICFAVQAMATVWERYPDCEMLLTGAAVQSPEGTRLQQQIASLQPKGRVRLCGLLNRADLLALYRQASALLIPLFADIRSIARFPIKIGEYLASGRPVVTSCVGEMPAFFKDGVNACVAIAGDAASFGERIVRVLDDPAWAAETGRNGWETARQQFHYSVHGATLLDFFERVRATRQPRSKSDPMKRRTRNADMLSAVEKKYVWHRWNRQSH